jgi:hypothetical protein
MIIFILKYAITCFQADLKSENIKLGQNVTKLRF